MGVHMINRQKLSAALEEYKKDFDSEWQDEKYKWQAVKCFQDNWDILQWILHQCLQNH